MFGSEILFDKRCHRLGQEHIGDTWDIRGILYGSRALCNRHFFLSGSLLRLGTGHSEKGRCGQDNPSFLHSFLIQMIGQEISGLEDVIHPVPLDLILFQEGLGKFRVHSWNRQEIALGGKHLVPLGEDVFLGVE